MARAAAHRVRRVRDGALREDGRPGRRLRRAAEGAGAARTPGHRVPAALRARSRSRRATSWARCTCRWTRPRAAPATTGATPSRASRSSSSSTRRSSTARLHVRQTTRTTACASRSSRRAALEYFRSRGERPDVFHAHDWQAGLLPVYLKSFYWDDRALYRSPTVFTIHNLAYQGNFGADTLGVLGLPWHLGSGRGRSSSTAASAT